MVVTVPESQAEARVWLSDLNSFGGSVGTDTGQGVTDALFLGKDGAHVLVATQAADCVALGAGSFFKFVGVRHERVLVVAVGSELSLTGISGQNGFEDAWHRRIQAAAFDLKNKFDQLQTSNPDNFLLVRKTVHQKFEQGRKDSNEPSVGVLLAEERPGER